MSQVAVRSEDLVLTGTTVTEKVTMLAEDTETVWNSNRQMKTSYPSKRAPGLVPGVFFTGKSKPRDSLPAGTSSRTPLVRIQTNLVICLYISNTKFPSFSKKFVSFILVRPRYRLHIAVNALLTGRFSMKFSIAFFYGGM